MTHFGNVPPENTVNYSRFKQELDIHIPLDELRPGNFIARLAIDEFNLQSVQDTEDYAADYRVYLAKVIVPRALAVPGRHSWSVLNEAWGIVDLLPPNRVVMKPLKSGTGQPLTFHTMRREVSVSGLIIGLAQGIFTVPGRPSLGYFLPLPKPELRSV